MGKKKGSWRKFFCCAGPPETQSSTCVNISESDHTKPPSVSDLEQEDEDLYIEAEVQTSNVEVPEGNRWRWSRLHNEVEVQTSFVSLPLEEVESSSETDAQVQTSFSSLPREIEAQAQTSFLSLRSPSPFEADAQIQTSFVELPREIEAQVQTSLLSLPEAKEAQVQTSFLSLPRGGSAGSLRGSAQASPSYLELLEKIASHPSFIETQVQTSNLSMPLSQIDIQVQTSFSDYMSEREDASSIETEPLRERSSSQLSEMDLRMYPLYTDAEVQTLPVEIPPGNDWRSTRLKAAAQIQTSATSVKEEPVSQAQNIIKVQPSKLEIEKADEMARVLESSLATEDRSLPSDLTETGIQTSDIKLQEWDKWCSPRQQVHEQVQTSTIELLKKLSLLSQIERMEPASRTELLKKMSSLSMAEAQVQTSSHELMRRTSALSESAIEDRVLSTDLLKKRPSSAQVSTLDYELAQMLSSSPRTKEAQMQTSDLELKKRLSSLSLTKMNNENKEEITEGKEYLITPQVIEHQIRKWYEELPEVQTSASQASVEKQPLWSSLVDSEVQTSYVDIPVGNKWRASRLQAEAEVQTERPELPIDEEDSCLQSDTQTQTSLLEVWQARDLAEAQLQTSILDVDEKVESPPPLVVDNQVQTSLLDIWKAKEQLTDVETQMSVTEHSAPAEQSDRLVQTSFLDLWKAKELDHMQQKTSETELLEPEVEASPPLHSDLGVQTSLVDAWRGKEKTNTQVQSSLLEFLEAQEQPLPPLQMDAQVQTSNNKMDMQVQTSIPNVEEANLEPPLASQMDTQVQTSLLDIWKAKEISETQAQTSWMDLPKSMEEPPVPLPSHMDTQVQTSLLDMWKTKELNEVQAQTPWTDLPKSVEEPPVPLPSHMDTQVQTSLLDMWKTKELNEVQAQTPWTDLPKSVEEPPVPLPSHMDTQVQTSLFDIWKTKELSDVQMQTPWADLSKSMEEPLIPPQPESPIQPPAPESVESPQIDTEVQTSSLDIWKTKELIDAKIQTSETDLPETTEALPLPPQIESSVQPSTTDLADSTAESPPPAQIDPEKQTSLSEMQKVKEPVDVQGQSSEFPKPGTESPPPSQADTEVQTSLLDTTPEKVPDAQTQSSRTELPRATVEPIIPSQTASPVQLPTPAKVDSALLAQDGAQLPMSLLKQWTTREEAELQKQTAKLGLSFEDDLALFPLLEEGQMKTADMPEKEKLEQVSRSKTAVFTEAQVQTSFVEIPRGKKWRASRLCTEAQVQTSFHDLHVKDRVPALQKMVADHVAAKRVPKGPRRAAPVSVHLHVKMSPKRRTSHSKTKAFITHGGTNGIYEAIYHGIPMVGIPMFADQPDNIAHMKAKGMAVELNFHTMTVKDLVDALNTVIHNPTYKENAVRLSQIHHDQPVKPLDRAIFWIEFVMRHKGAKHLRPAAHHLTWYQYHSLDVIGFLTGCLAVFIFIAVKCCSFCCYKCGQVIRKTKTD